MTYEEIKQALFHERRQRKYNNRKHKKFTINYIANLRMFTESSMKRIYRKKDHDRVIGFFYKSSLTDPESREKYINEATEDQLVKMIKESQIPAKHPFLVLLKMVTIFFTGLKYGKYGERY